jgi:hypothetical protein
MDERPADDEIVELGEEKTFCKKVDSKKIVTKPQKNLQDMNNLFG